MKNQKPPTIQQLFDSISKWQIRTFDNATATGASEHLRREAEEVWNLFWSTTSEGKRIPRVMRPNTEDVAEELADMLHMVVQLAQVEGIDLRDALAKKYAKNLNREWKPADADGVVEHVKA